MNKTLRPILFVTSVIFLLILSNRSLSAKNRSLKQSKNFPKKDFRYRTSFGQCPSRSVGTLTLKLVKIFEEKRSLKDVKKLIVDEEMVNKHFLSSYNIKYNPLKKIINLEFDCPEPLMRVQVYKDSTSDSYEAILVSNGRLFDPTYEALLRTEKKLTKTLPFLALPVGEMDENIQLKITSLFKDINKTLKSRLSEIIVNDKGELTIILSSPGIPTSVFMGVDSWDDKIMKLQKIVSYMKSKGKTPAIINLTNAKKVVVKFNDKF